MVDGRLVHMPSNLHDTLTDAVEGTVARDVPIAPLTTFRIGGSADLLVQPASRQDVVAVLRVCSECGVPLYILGAGSNLIVPDEGLRGVVLRLPDGIDDISLHGDTIVCGAGVLDCRLAEFALGHQVTGFEWIFDIPGSVGGAVYMNAGNNDGEISHSLVLAKWVSPDGELHEAGAEELKLGYRTSRFHNEPGIIVEAVFAISARADGSSIRGRMDSIKELRGSKFPEESLCAGSIFKRPLGDYAGRLIEEAGCGGMSVGGALVSHKHKGFIVNRGDATASDVLTLIEQVRRRVLEHSGVELETEVEVFSPIPTTRRT